MGGAHPTLRESMIKVTHVINGLITGGAEMTLCRLLSNVDRERFDMDVISLAPEMGQVGHRLRELGYPVSSVNLSGKRAFRSTTDLYRRVRFQRPDVVQTWMYHAGVLGGVIARMATDAKVVWNIRQADLARDRNKNTTLVAAALSRRLAPRIPHRIIFGSLAAKTFHKELGYPEKKMVVIPNGFEIYPPSALDRHWLRQHLGLSLDVRLVGRVGRFHKYKDYETLIEAAGYVSRAYPLAHFVLCGAGVDGSNTMLRQWILRHGVSDHVHLLGERADVGRIHGGLDIACSSSLGEAFPNVVAEAMAAGIPVVATDVGDSAHVIGGTGRLVPPRNPRAMADAILEMLMLPLDTLRAMGTKAQKRIEKEFSLEQMKERYCSIYEQLALTATRSESRPRASTEQNRPARRH